MKNLIESWLAAETSIPGFRAADALRDLNEILGTRYTHSHISRWRRGIQQPNRTTRRYMLEHCIWFILREAGVNGMNDKKLDSIAAALS